MQISKFNGQKELYFYCYFLVFQAITALIAFLSGKQYFCPYLLYDSLLSNQWNNIATYLNNANIKCFMS